MRNTGDTPACTHSSLNMLERDQIQQAWPKGQTYHLKEGNALGEATFIQLFTCRHSTACALADRTRMGSHSLTDLRHQKMSLGLPEQLTGGGDVRKERIAEGELPNRSINIIQYLTVPWTAHVWRRQKATSEKLKRAEQKIWLLLISGKMRFKVWVVPC